MLEYRYIQKQAYGRTQSSSRLVIAIMAAVIGTATFAILTVVTQGADGILE